MTHKDFRRIALALTDAIEGSHMDHPDFRLNNKIFATLHPGLKSGMVKLTPEQQQTFISEDPASFAPEAGAWGRAGCTRVKLAKVDEDDLGQALTLAWQNLSSAQRSSIKKTRPATKPTRKPTKTRRS